MSEDRSSPNQVEKLAHSAAVSGAVNDINAHRHGFVPPIQTTVFAPNGSGLNNAPLVAKAKTVGHSISAPGQGMEMQVGSGAMHQAMLDAQEVERASRLTSKSIFLSSEAATDKGKDSKGKEGASVDASAAEKSVEASPAINAVLSNLAEKGTRDRINDATGQTPEHQQPQQQDAKKAAEKTNDNAAMTPAKKGKLGGLDKATADSVNNGSLGALSKGKDKEKEKPKVATVSNSSLPKPPATPPRPQPPKGHAAPSATPRR